MTARRFIPAYFVAFLILCSLASPAVSQPSIVVNEFYRAGNLGATDEWVELVLRVPLTAAQLEGFYVGDSTGTTASKFSGYKFTNMASIAANFPAGTIIVVAGTTGPAADTAYNPGSGDWNITLKTAGTNLTSNGNTGDFAATDVAYVDTNGTNGNATLSSSGFAVNWHATPGAFGSVASVTITAPANNTGAVLNGAVENAATAANWSSSIALASLTPGQPNGGANTTSINALRAAAPGTPTLNVNDVSLAEGNPPGTTTFTFTVSLSAPAGPGGVTFDIATADGTAQDDNPVAEDNDYVPQSLTGQTIPAGSSTYAFNVTVNRDTTSEANETFFVNVTNVVGATAGDAQGQGTIQNDDVSVVYIHDVQGAGTMSGMVGASVTVVGIVTGVKSNGFFVQEEDSDALLENNPATSEGIFVFTSSAPPAAAAFGAQVQVTGTVAEFVPSTDPMQPPLTELTSPTTVRLQNPGVLPLPTPVALTPTFPNPAGAFDQLERVEGMRVSATSMTVTGPSDGSINEPNNTGTSNGRFFAVVTGVARPFREPGIRQPDVPPVGTIPPIPRWDTNPELLGVESAAINSQPVLTVKTSDTVAPIVGPLDYGFRRYAIYPDGTNTITVTPGTLPTTVTAPTAREFTVASWNMFHLYDTVGGQALSASAYADRLNKSSIAIRNNLQMPDILGVQEVENLTVLQDLATKINNDAVANAQPNPQYVAYLSEGNDPGGIDVGYLVKTAPVAGGAPRVAVNSVTQIGKTTQWTQPNGVPDDLHDRPPLVLDAVINRAPGASFPVVVINNHLKSLIGIDSTSPHGPTTDGDRNRRKRQLQADFVADYIQGRINANPNEHIILVGDYNAFEFNDGYADVINTIMGTPPPDAATVVCSTCPQPPNTEDGVDQLNPDMTDLVTTPPPSERYSYVHEGNAQNLDHVIVSATVVTDTTARRVEHPRIGADYPETERANASSPLRVSEHDPVVGYFDAITLSSADVGVTKTDSPDPVNAGQNVTYTVTVTNGGPDPASNVTLTDPLPTGTTSAGGSFPAGWSCTTPTLGTNGTWNCSIASLAVGSTDIFTIVATVDPTVASGTVLSNTATVTTSTSDPTSANNSATATTTVAMSADLQISKTDSPDPVTAGNNLTYQLTLTNNGPSNTAATFSDTLPAGTTFVSLSTTGSWTCTTPAVGANGTVTCNNSNFLVTADFFTLVVKVDPTVATGTVLSNTATLSSSTPDTNGANNSATATTTVATSADLLLSKTDTPDPVNAGSNLSYQITLTNSGPSNAASATFTDTLPADTTFVSLSTTGPWTCTTPGVGTTGTVTCTNPSYGGVDFFTLVVNVSQYVPAGTVLSNTATLSSATPDPNGANNSSTATTTVSTASDMRITKVDTPDPVTAGNNLTYTINVGNFGPSDATGATFTDTIPANTTFVSLTTFADFTCTTPAVGGTGLISCSKPSTFVANSSGNFILVVNVNGATASGTVITNTANIATSTVEVNGANNSATATTTVGVGSADVSVTKFDSPDPVNAGANLVYSITVTNAGPSAATSVSLADTVPVGTTFVAFTAPGGWTCSTPAIGATGAISCTNPTLGVTSALFTLTVNVDPTLLAGNVLSNTATVSTATTDPNGANNNATATTTVTASADLLLSKGDSPDPVFAGSNISYQLTLTNNGPSNAASASFSDTLPAGTTFVSISTTGPWTCTTPAVGATGTVTCTNPSFGVTVDFFTIVVQTNAGLASGTVLINTATLTSATTDPNGANNSSTATTTIGVGSADVSITKVDTPDPVNAGANITYTITVNNAGPTNAASASMSDTLPAGTTFVSLSAPAGWTCTTPAVGAGGTVSCTNPSLGTGSALFSLVVRVAPATAPGTVITNTATVSSTTADPNPGNQSATTTTSVVSPANVTGTKTVAGTFVPGGSITYTIVLTNNGASTQQNNPGDEFVDVLPASLTLVSANATGGTALATPATRTVTWNGSIAAGASVTITINATIRSDATPGTSVANQGTINYDADGNGTNESTRQTDSPAAPGAADATTFIVGAAEFAPVPTLDELALLALAALLAAVAAFVLKR